MRSARLQVLSLPENTYFHSDPLKAKVTMSYTGEENVHDLIHPQHLRQDLAPCSFCFVNILIKGD